MHKRSLKRSVRFRDSNAHSNTHIHTFKKKQVQHASDADVRLLAAVTPLLTRKEQLVRALNETNRDASVAKVLTPELKQKFVDPREFGRNEQSTSTLMNRFSKRFSKGASESWSASFNDMVARTSRAIARHGGTRANILNRNKTGNLMAMMSRTNTDPSRMDIRTN